MNVARDRPAKCAISTISNASTSLQFPESLEVNLTRVGGSSGHDNLWLMFRRELFDFIKIDQRVLSSHALLNRIEPFTRQIWRRSLGQVSNC